MSDLRELISGLFLFRGCDFSEIDRVFHITEKIYTEKYRRNELILSSDKHTDAICIIAGGKIRITSNTGEKDTVLRYAGRGETFGVAILFSSVGHSTEVYAESDAEIIFLEKTLLCELISNSSSVAINYIEFLSDKISFLNRKVAAFTAANAEVKLAMFINGNADENGNVSSGISMTKLADELGIGRASLYRAIDSLVASGVIEYNGKSFSVIDHGALNQIIK